MPAILVTWITHQSIARNAPMKLAVRARNTTRIFMTSLLLLGGPASAQTAGERNSGEAVNGLQMAIRLDSRAGTRSGVPGFRIDLHNAGPSDFVLNLGVMLANGKRQFANALVLTLTDALGKSRQLNLREPYVVFGRLDPLVLPLPVGSTFSVPVELNNYWAAASQEFDYKLMPGTHTIRVQFTGNGVSPVNADVQGLSLMPYWTGTLISNQLRFEVAGR
jgi:hypothetical protein